jgi:NAD(P)-dependent dehydrogenase (short-subunit alcohol dehydrogenase family)
VLDRQGQVVLISGANRGIGRAIAERLATDGWKLSLGLRRPDSPIPPLPAELLVQPYDAGDTAAAPRWVAATLARFGRIDAVVANAGIWLPARLADGDPAAVEAMWRVNAMAPLHLVRAAWEPLKASGAGRFLAVASLSGKRATGPNVGYAMSKFALVGLTQQVKRDGWEHGIRATALCPGFVATDMASTATPPRETLTQPEDLAELVATVLRLPNSAAVGELLVNWRMEAGF